MSTSSSRSGFSFSAVEIVIAVVTIAIIGFLGYSFYANYQKSQMKTNDSLQSAETTDAPAITSTEDLDKAASVLDESDLETNSSSDLSEMDKDLNKF